MKNRTVAYLLASCVVVILVAGCSLSSPESAKSDESITLQNDLRDQAEVAAEPLEFEVAAEESLIQQQVVETEVVVVPTQSAPGSTMYFEDYGVNPFIDVQEDHLSTFAIDVDTGSYSIARRYIRDGIRPPVQAVRVEEFINFFDQAYVSPAETPFAIHLEGAPSPYGQNDRVHLARVGIQGYKVPADERPDAMLIFVIDISGSMNMGNRLGLVKESLKILVDQLRPTDRIGIVVYGERAHIVLEPTYVDSRRTILRAIDRLQTEGSTNAAEGIMMAYELAAEFSEAGHISRLILCSDGVANVGPTTADAILQQAEEGISLSTFGFGMGNYNDVLMEQLADRGDGSYAYVDSIREAERLFVTDLTGTLLTIAKDAKIQVEFNPSVVERYRLLGYENRDIADEDFRNDDVDAGEIGAGHSVTALYELEFKEDAPDSDVVMTVRIRYAHPESGLVSELERTIQGAEFLTEFEQASPTFQLSAVVAEFAEILRDSQWAQGHSLSELAIDASRIAEYRPLDEDVREFAELVALASQLES